MRVLLGKLFTKLFKSAVFMVVLLVLGPYILAIGLYLLLKKYATSDSALEESVIEMEIALMEVAQGIISIYSPGFITLITLSLVFLFVIFIMLRQYKIVIP
ncbi:hypothetical protein [Leifsonia shinshuensis]|uniref:hypothetical protein n=1 Tax=Leifsonia shinshuensis TaxID=150026 RepID=UPI0035EA9008